VRTGSHQKMYFNPSRRIGAAPAARNRPVNSGKNEEVFRVLALALLAASAFPAERGFLEKKGTMLYLEGKPFFEISFNKFDLLWELLGAEFPKKGRTGYGEDPAAAAETAMRELGGFGFKTVRAFCALPEAYFDPGKRERYLAAVDRLLEWCDRYDLRMVFSLSAHDYYFARATGETHRDMIGRRQSKSRKLYEEFVRDMVLRYRDRPAVAMWEMGNEVLLHADIGGKSRMFQGMVMPSLDEVAAFHKDMTAFIKRLDRRHLVTTGDSHRFCQWHLRQYHRGKEKNGWAPDSARELERAIGKAQKGVDVYCTHFYDPGMRGENQIRARDGGLQPLGPPELLRFAVRAGKPFYLGEYGVLPLGPEAKDAKKRAANPEWFTSFADDPERARREVNAALEAVVAARVNLTHWWCYSSDRDLDRRNPQRMDISWRSTPDLVRLVIEANRRLQMATMGFTYARPQPGSHDRPRVRAR
jgi:hypothetical protein